MQRKKLDSITIIEHRPFINVWKFLHSRLFFFVLTLNVRIIKYCLMHHNNTNFIAFCVPCATDCRCKRYFKQTKNYNLPAFRRGLALLDRHNTLNAAFYYSDDCSLQFFLYMQWMSFNTQTFVRIQVRISIRMCFADA